MREYGQVQCSFWTHPKVVELSTEAKLLACYVLTGPHSNGLGCYRLPDGYVIADLGWSQETVSKAFRDLSETGLIVRCDRTQWLLVPDYLEWNAIANPKVAAARIKEAREVPRHASIWPAMVAALSQHGRKHLPKDFVQILDQEWMPVAARVPDETKRQLWHRDNKCCRQCQSTEDLTIDHIRPLSYGGTHHLENLQVLCRSCNSARYPSGGEMVSEPYGNGFQTVSKQDPDPDPEQDPERETPSAGDAAASDKRDLLWEAVLDACGVTGKSPTKSERGAWNKAVKEIRDAGGQPDEVAGRAQRYAEIYPDATLTPTALARHWGQCASDAKVRPMGKQQKLEQHNQQIAKSWADRRFGNA